MTTLSAASSYPGSQGRPGRPRTEDSQDCTAVLKAVCTVLGAMGKERSYFAETGPMKWHKLNSLSNGGTKYNMDAAMGISEWMKQALRDHTLATGTDRDKQDFTLDPELIHPIAAAFNHRVLFKAMVYARLLWCEKQHAMAKMMWQSQDEQWNLRTQVEKARGSAPAASSPAQPMETL